MAIDPAEFEEHSDLARRNATVFPAAEAARFL
jgi:hypothetical protein